MPQARSWQEMSQQIAQQLRRETGMDVAGWNARIRSEARPADEAALRRWLAARAVKGYPALLLVYETFGYPDYLEATADELIDGQYRDRPGLRPIFDRLVDALPSIGTVELQARKGYVALIGPRRTFASIQATTKTRLDVGLRLDGVAPAGRLEPAKSIGQSSMTHKVSAASVEEVDDELLGWVRRAYDANT